MNNSSDTHQPAKGLGLLDATMIVAGSMIGSGIFLVAASMSRDLGSAGWMLFAWLLTGIITVFAALSYGELAGMMPEAGGQFVYISRAFGKLTGFVYGWSVFAVIQTGVIAAVAVAFANYSAVFLSGLNNVLIHWGNTPDEGFTVKYTHLLAVAMVLFLTWANSRGLKTGKIIQLTFTSAKLLSLAALIIGGIWLGTRLDWFSINFSDAWKASSTVQDPVTKTWTTTPLEGIGIVFALGTALVGSLFSADAWNNVTFIAGEIRDPKRNIPRSLFLGTAIVTILYFLANVAYTGLLPLHGDPAGTTVSELGIQHATEGRVGTAAASQMLGENAVLVMAALIMVSTFGCNNGLIMAGARLYYAMANEGLFFKKAATLNRNDVPGFALWIQAIWASVLCLSGTYNDLLDYTIFASLLFYMITIAGIFVLRRKEPDAPRPYKAFGYPWIPALYILFALFICLDLLWFKSRNAGFGLLIVLTGIPVYLLTSRRKNSS